ELVLGSVEVDADVRAGHGADKQRNKERAHACCERRSDSLRDGEKEVHVYALSSIVTVRQAERCVHSRARRRGPFGAGAKDFSVKDRHQTTSHEIERYAGLFAKRTGQMRSSAMRDL